MVNVLNVCKRMSRHERASVPFIYETWFLFEVMSRALQYLDAFFTWLVHPKLSLASLKLKGKRLKESADTRVSRKTSHEGGITESGSIAKEHIRSRDSRVDFSHFSTATSLSSLHCVLSTPASHTEHSTPWQLSPPFRRQTADNQAKQWVTIFSKRYGIGVTRLVLLFFVIG